MSCPRERVLSLSLALLLSAAALAKKPAQPSAARPPPDPETLENVCDLVTQVEAMYCYCDHLERGDATNANCWVYNPIQPDDLIWDTFYHQPNIERLMFGLRNNGTMAFVPTTALSYLRHLYVVDVNNALISQVSPDAFGRSSSISEIELSGNGIEKLERHAFSSLTNLTRLNLGENKLVGINRHVFVDMPKLQQLFLDRNHLSRIRNGAFADLENLRVLELYGNRLKQVSIGTFKGLRRLQRLDLHRNQLKVIGDRSFAELPELSELDLSENHIKYISGNALQGVPKLMRLMLQDNRIKELQPGTFEGTQNLFYLNVQKNLLETLDVRVLKPIRENLRNITMYFYMAENRLLCDCRLGWLQRLRARTASAHVQAAVDAATCLSSAATAAGGHGKQLLNVVDLKVSELPCDLPLAEEPVEPTLKEEVAPVQHTPVEEQKLRSLSAAPEQVRASAQVTAAAPAAGGRPSAAGSTDPRNRAPRPAAHAPALALILLVLAVR